MDDEGKTASIEALSNLREVGRLYDAISFANARSLTVPSP